MPVHNPDGGMISINTGKILSIKPFFLKKTTKSLCMNQNENWSLRKLPLNIDVKIKAVLKSLQQIDENYTNDFKRYWFNDKF